MKTIKTWLTTIAALLCSITASAHDFEVNGIYYNITSEDDLTVEVTYQGSYNDSYSNEYSGAVTIPSIVTCNSKTYSVTSIGIYAFYDCSGLTSITIPESVTSIGNNAFDNCSSLTSITLPESVTSIGDYAFSGTAWYDNLPEGVVYIGKVLYTYKGTMPENTSIEVKEGTISISPSAFCDCSSLTSITIPESVTSIRYRTFYGCSSLTSITIPESVTSIGNYAFEGCSSLTSITIPESVTSIGIYAFYDCSGLTSITIPEGVTNIGSRTFSNCSSLTSITIPEGVTSIENYAFSSCSSLTSITIPEGVTSIGYHAFSYCSSLTSITILEGVTSIGNHAFSDCSSLTSIVVAEDNKVYDSRKNCNAIIETNSNTLIFGCSATIIPESVTSIGSYAFSSCSSLTSITIPESVTSIGLEAFRGCSSLTSITIPESVTSLSGALFSNCSNLSDITINATISNIDLIGIMGSGAHSVKSLSIGKNVSGIKHNTSGLNLANNWSNLERIIVDEDNPTYDSRDNCNAIIETATNKLIVGCLGTVIPKSVTTIGSCAFAYISNLTAMVIPNNVTTLMDAVFYNCTSLSEVYISSSVSEILPLLFGYCENLKSITCGAITPPTVVSVAGMPYYAKAFYGVPVAECVLYVPEESVDSYKAANIWSEFGSILPIARSVEILDGEDFVCEEDKECASITYTRTLSKTNTWNALYVPFEIPVTADFLEDYDVAYFNDIHSYDEYVGEKEDGVFGSDGVIDRMDMEVLKVQEGTTLNANYPYLIRAKNEEALNMNIKVEDATLYKTVETTVSCSSVFMRFDVTGIYTTQTAGELKGEFDVYAMSGGGWKQALSESQQLKPFRLYLKLTSIDGFPVKVAQSAMKAIRIRVDGEETTIIDNAQLTMDNEETIVYDLQGRRVENPGKGIYIVNGKKTVIK